MKKTIAFYHCASAQFLPPKERKKFYKKVNKVLKKFLGEDVLLVPGRQGDFLELLRVKL